MATIINEYQSDYDFLYFIRMKEDNRKHWDNQKHQNLKEDLDESINEISDLDDEEFVYF